MNEATVNITDAVHHAVRVERKQIRVGDIVFDTYGGQHKIVKVRHFKHTTTAVRDDGPSFSLVGRETITVVREA